MRPDALRSNQLNIGLRPLVKALSLGLGLSALPLPAHALLLTDTYGISASGSVTDQNGGSGSSGALSASTNIDQFDSSLGVLMGTTIGLNSTLAQSVFVTGTRLAGTTGNQDISGNGTATSIALTAPGTSTTFPNAGFSAKCSASAGGSCASTTSAKLVDLDVSVTLGGALSDPYVGIGTVAVSQSANLSNTTTDSKFTVDASSFSQYTAKWSGAATDDCATTGLCVQYDYLLHAAPSFDSIATQLVLNLDLGTVLQNSADPTSKFNIYNLLGDRVGLDLDKISVSGDDPQLTTNLATFAALAAGGFMSFSAVLDTATVGSFAETYTLFLSDADVGAPTSRFNNFTLTLNLTGTVVPQVTPTVPEPGTLGLLGAGMLGLGWLRRRRR
jgi:hypothetical protein